MWITAPGDARDAHRRGHVPEHRRDDRRAASWSRSASTACSPTGASCPTPTTASTIPSGRCRGRASKQGADPDRRQLLAGRERSRHQRRDDRRALRDRRQQRRHARHRAVLDRRRRARARAQEDRTGIIIDHRPDMRHAGVAHAVYGRASSTMLNGVSAARRTRLKPPSPSTSVRRCWPAWAPSASADLLAQRRRRAEHRRATVEDAPARVEVLLDRVARRWLDDHPCAVARRAARARGARRRPGRPCRAARRTRTPDRTALRRSPWPRRSRSSRGRRPRCARRPREPPAIEPSW